MKDENLKQKTRIEFKKKMFSVNVICMKKRFAKSLSNTFPIFRWPSLVLVN